MPARYGTVPDQEKAILRVLERIAEAPARQWTVEDLAHVAMFSKFHFTRIFQRHVGVSPHRYLMRFRIELAKELLERTPHYVSGIARVLGYTSIGTFSSRFSHDVGCSPSMYRQYAAYAQELDTETQEWFRSRPLDRDMHRLGLSWDPRDLPEFGDSLPALYRQLDEPAPVTLESTWVQRHPH
jgi:AraC-like DNA-binding protein